MNRESEKKIRLYNEIEHEKKSLKIYITLLVLSYIIIIAGIFFAIKLIGVSIKILSSNFAYMLYSSPLVLFGGIIAFEVRIISRKYKNLLVYSSLENTFDNLSFSPDLGVYPLQIVAAGLRNRGDSFKVNDYVSGTYKDVDVEQCDVITRGFVGRLLIFQFNKFFTHNLRVCENGFPYRHTEDVNGNKYTKIETESIPFNDRFTVYSTNDSEAFYLLTPHIMECLCTLCDETNGKMLFSFVENHLYVSINNHKDSFEPPLFGKMNIENESVKVYNDIKLITQFVDELQLDVKVYK